MEEFYETDSECELVVITTSNDTHFRYCKEAIENGRDIVVEKPFTINSVDAEELMNLAKEKGVGISVYQSKPLSTSYSSKS